MREFKFRGWNKIIGKMYENIGYRDGLIFINHDYDEDGDITISSRLIFEEDEIEVMQYTGFKDINDIEIYEGDIVQFYNDKEYKLNPTSALVIYELGAFMLKHKELGKEYLGKMDIEDMIIKVIGNIYENPELLN